jgi:putative tricarboxylic transport membrane protein
MFRRLGFLLPLALAGFYEAMTERIPALAFGDPLGPRVFPRLIVAGLIVSSVLWFLESTIADKREKDAMEISDNKHFFTAMAVTGCLLLYIVALVPLGYVLSTLAFLLILTSYFNKGKWATNVASSVAFPVASYLLFTKVLGVALPSGSLLPL